MERGEMVRLVAVPPWVVALPDESREVLEFCLGKVFPVDHVDANGLVVLDVSGEVDARFGGTMNDIRVEETFLERAGDGEVSG